MTREEMWEEFESQLKSEVRTMPMTMSYDKSIRLAEMGIQDVVARWKKRLEQEPKWIPCTERLPEKEYENYLVSTSDGEVDIGSYGSEKGWSMCDADGFYYPRHRGIEVVAWMPLPEPYKEQKAR